VVQVNFGVPNETDERERRVALTPAVAESLIDDGHAVTVEAGAGAGAHLSDDAFTAAGCTVVDDRDALLAETDVLLRVSPLPTALDGADYAGIEAILGLLAPYEISEDTREALADAGVSVAALELLPRISRAQSMDALSSQASLAGYQAVLAAAESHPKLFPMEMTAAGTIRPADVLVIGAGVAGLKAVATAERLGASTTAYDVRLEVREEVESLGADFLELDLETEGSGDEEGYARKMDDAFYAAQRAELERVVPETDVLITSAAIPGAPAPELVTESMIADMDDGSVVIDLSAPTGGNCEPTVAGETVTHDGVTILGPENLASEVATTASQQYANNLQAYLEVLLDEGTLTVDLDDEIIDATMLVHDGQVRNPHLEAEDAEDSESQEKQDAAEKETTTAADREDDNE
jgi:NAD(P) transhydrogenase subunit alpha